MRSPAELDSTVEPSNRLRTMLERVDDRRHVTC